MIDVKDLQVAIEHNLAALKRSVRNLRKFQKGEKLTYPKAFMDHPIVHLRDEDVVSAKIFASRSSLLASLSLPKNSFCCEVGTSTGAFAKEILAAFDPEELHVIDIDFSRFDEGLRQNIAVSKHLGDSTKILSGFSDNYFDFIYVDADHGYDSVVSELKVIRRKIKPGAIVMFNDYTNWSLNEVQPYGVVAAVNQFVRDTNAKVIGVALSGTAHHDVALRMPAA